MTVYNLSDLFFNTMCYNDLLAERCGGTVIIGIL